MSLPDDTNHRRSNTTPQSIPLQDLNHATTFPALDAPAGSHRRTLSDRGRRLFARDDTGRYSSLMSAGRTSHIQQVQDDDDQDDDEHGGDAAFSPLADRGGFQEALGFAGLSFGRDTSHNTHTAGLTSPDEQYPLRPILERNDSSPSLAGHGYDEGSLHNIPIDEDDMAPLTDAHHLQPVGVSPSADGSHADSTRRANPRRVRISMIEQPTHIGARLGDDLAQAEAGLRSRSMEIRRSGSLRRSLSPLSPDSPLHRAGTIVRKMSQRVVNLSNDSDLIEQEAQKRRPSVLGERRGSEATTRHSSMSAGQDGGVDDSASSIEKPSMSVEHDNTRSQSNSDNYNPLRGKSLGFISPDNRLRLALCEVLSSSITETIVLLLIIAQTILLAIDSGTNIADNTRPPGWGSSAVNYALLGIFGVYTVEVMARIIVSGFIINPVEYSTIRRRELGLKNALRIKGRTLFALHVRRPKATEEYYEGFRGSGRDMRRKRLGHRAFLRHSFNRLDFVAVVAFWISFALDVAGYETSKHIYLFRMLSCLRILRLLALTSGTKIILTSLKEAAPLLLNVALLIGFFWLLFAIIGVQSFKSSLRRTCVWVDPAGQQANYTLDMSGNFQFCGGSLAANGSTLPYLFPDGSSSGITKGYLCPPNSYCVSSENPYNGTVSFDNVFQSLELVFVVMTSNTYTDIMYYLTDSDYLAAALFFAGGIVVMTFWLMNLLIAVITSQFQVQREEKKRSAFADQPSEPVQLEKESAIRSSSLMRFYEHTEFIWIGIIAYGLVCQCLRASDMSATRAIFISVSETVVTFVLLFEIIMRICCDWRNFFGIWRNWIDLGLAIITTILQIPAVHDSGQTYAWLTVFQILRIYRVVLAVPFTRDLILLVLGNVSGLANLILFVFLLTFLVSIFASQLFRGELPSVDANGNTIHITFATIYNSFLGMYQVFSSENWTTILYNVTTYDNHFNTAWYGALFFILWFILGFFIVLNMFIAVIQENFDVSEDEKRVQQVKVFLKRKELGQSSDGTLSLASLFKFPGRLRGQRDRDALEYGPAMMEMLLKEAVVQEFLDDDQNDPGHGQTPNSSTVPRSGRPLSTALQSGLLSTLPNKVTNLFRRGESNPFYSDLQFSKAEEELDPRSMAREVISANDQRRRAQRDYLRRHPNYNVSLFVFKPNNPIRRICQRIVTPGRGGERAEGVAPSPTVWYAFSAVLYATIVAMVLLACITTPLYQKQYFTNKAGAANWFVVTDLAFAIIFSVEAVIRVIADGFFWTPNAYYRSSWGFIDGVVLVTLWINVGAAFYNEGAVSRAVGAFKALRALRLLNVSDSARETFHSVIIQGSWKLLSAAFLSLSLLIPFAIYGLNLFNGKMRLCNDTGSGIFHLQDCVNEFESSPYNNNWPVIAPRTISNPYYSFDSFGESLFILFQIVSQEGWVDVMWSAESITGVFTQPRAYAAQGNAVFFVIFNLLGAVFVLTLFVSVFMRNYTEQTGVAFLTADQRAWLELRKVLRQISPSKRPSAFQKRSRFNRWCYRLAVRKTGRWQRFVTIILMFHLLLLCLEFYPTQDAWDITRNFVFLALTIFYIANVGIRIIGLTWSKFRRSSWDLFSLAAISGTFITTVLFLSDYQPENTQQNHTVYQQLHKLFLVSIVLLLIPRNNQLDQLFKTAAASLGKIAELLATWFVLFLVYAIAFTQTFGLTRFNSNETGNINFRSVPKALILLFRTSTGEGWNQLMEDFATVQPPFCTDPGDFLLGDCGSPEWARVLFISWNILSMYIFVNMFVSLIYESFSYVYQRSAKSGLSAVSREEIRSFKSAWSEFDPDGTGYISKENFPQLLGELPVSSDLDFKGVFDMRIYSSDFSVQQIVYDCRKDHRASQLPIEGQGRSGREKIDEIDLKKLNEKLAQIPVETIRRNRRLLNVFYGEVLSSADPDKGIGFTQLLMTLAHYTIINDNKSLRLEEFLRRRARLQRVEDDVRRSVVSNFLDTLYYSRRFKQHMRTKQAGRMKTIPQLQVPEIFVDDSGVVSPTSPQDTTPSRPRLSLQIPSIVTSAPGQHEDYSDSASGYSQGRTDSIQVSPAVTPPRPSISIRDQHHRAGSDVSNASLGAYGYDGNPPSPIEGENPFRTSHPDQRSRANSALSAQDVREVFDSSAWGESIRRSFTTVRKSSDMSRRER